MLVTYVDLEFADGSYVFQLNHAACVALEERRGAMGAVFSRVFRTVEGVMSLETGDLTEIIRQGLIGGGKGVVDGLPVTVDPARANALVRDYVMNRPMAETLPIAHAVVSAAFFGVEAEPVAAD